MLAWHELLTDLAWHEILHRHFRPSQSRKWITDKWLTHGNRLQEVAVWGKLKKPPSSRPILMYFEFRSKPSLITVIWMDPHSPKKFIATKYCFLILREDTSFFFLIISLFFVFLLLFYVINSFYKNYFIIVIFFFFHENYFYFFMFRDVPACSEMFRNVPCSWFYRRPWLIWSGPYCELYCHAVCT